MKPVIHEPCCLCHSPTLRPWIDSLVLRGGVLEPGALMSTEKERAKARAIVQLAFSVPTTEDLSLSGGASVTSSAFSS
jgi:hypothetical protein